METPPSHEEVRTADPESTLSPEEAQALRINHAIDGVQAQIDALPGMDIEEQRRIVAGLLSDRFVTFEPKDAIVGEYVAHPKELHQHFERMRPPLPKRTSSPHHPPQPLGAEAEVLPEQ